MGNTPSAHKISDQDKAILDLKNQRDTLHKYQRRITVLTSREVAIAKELLAKGDKPRALLALRRKKYQESLLQQTDAQLEQLERLTGSVEFALVQKDVVFGLQQGTKVLGEINREMGGIERVERLLEEGAEARAYQEEISDLLGGKISNADEDEVEDELDAMEAELNKASGTKIELPDVPTKELPPKERAKERQRQREEVQGKLADEAMLA